MAAASKTRVGICHQATFSAESTMITAVPEFNYDSSVPLLSCRQCKELGPFVAGMPCQVPLWMGKILHERQLAKIQVPEWLEPEALVTILKYEKDNDAFSTEIPFYYYEIARNLGPVLPKSTHLLIQDVCSIRVDKLRSQFHGMSQGILQEYDPQQGEFPMIAVTGIANIELIILGPFLKQAMADYNFLTNTKSKAEAKELDDFDNAFEEEEETTPAVNKRSLVQQSRLRRQRDVQG